MSPSSIPETAVELNGGPSAIAQGHTQVPVIIERSHGWLGLNWRELWAYRGLLYFLTWRDVKVRYKQTVLGAAWAVIQPLFTMVIFTIVFGKFAGMPSDGIPYPLFAYVGTLGWAFFSNAITSGGNSVVSSANLITKTYFPRIIIPAAAVVAGLVDFAVALPVLAGLLIYYRAEVSWKLSFFPVVVVLATLLALGVGMLLAALNVKYRDIRHALPFLVQVWIFVTPVIYPASLVPSRWRWLLRLNPMTGIIEAYRASLLSRRFDWGSLAASAVLTLVILTCGLFIFRRTEKGFADVI